MKLKPYAMYQSSGVEWLGDVPEHWLIRRMKRIATTTCTDGKMAAGVDSTNMCRFIGMDAVESWTGRMVDSTRLPLTAVATPQRGFRRGDVLFGRLRPYLAKSCMPDFDGLCSGEFLVLEGSDDFDNRYLLYLLLTSYLVTKSDASTSGTKMPRTNWQEVGSVLVPVPPIREQRAICCFLNGATAKIDTLVAQTRNLIERLQEKRRALITEIVTRGLPPDENRRASLDPCPKMRPSGVEWLGDVPAHWKTQRSDRLVRFQNLDMILPATFRNGPVVHYSIPSVQEVGAGIVEDGDTIQSAKQHIKNRVLLVSRLNPRKSTICYAEPDDHLTTVASVEFVALLPLLVDSRYLYYLAHSELFRQRLDSHVRSVTRSHQRTPPRSIRQFWHAWPPQAEQNAIATFLDRHTAKIDALIDKSRTLIERLREKRQATITAAVTGQIDVRDEGRGKTE